MAIPCDRCGAENPSTNRFCGQCGSNLQVPAAAPAPEEFRLDPPQAHFNAAADLPPEVIDFDNRIPLFASEREDRRIHVPSEIENKVHDHLEREAELHDQLHHANETHYAVRTREDSAASFLSSPPPSQAPSHTGVSGPSFLGLSEDQPADYLLEDDEAPRSHWRRNLALTVVAAAIALAAVQWRSMRDYGLAYIQNGSMQVMRRSKDTPKNPPAVAADNTGRDLGLAPEQAKPGAPKALENSPNAERTPPEKASSEPPAQPGVSSPQPTAPAQPSAMSAPPDQPSADRVEANPTPASHRAAAKPEPRTPKHTEHEKPVPGADEMLRAARASDSEASVVWLWRALGKGNPEAPVVLARMYEQGNGVVRSCDQARVLLRSAAAKGNEEAKLGLQQMRNRGNCR